jgi:hypothetical protein
MLMLFMLSAQSTLTTVRPLHLPALCRPVLCCFILFIAGWSALPYSPWSALFHRVLHVLLYCSCHTIFEIYIYATYNFVCVLYGLCIVLSLYCIV